MPAISFIFYSFVTSSYILNAHIGFSLDMTLSYMIGGVFTAAVFAGVIYLGRKKYSERLTVNK